MPATLQARIAQTYLQQLGFYQGIIDGKWGDLSAAAADTWRTSIAPAPVTAPVTAPVVPEVAPGTSARTLKNIASLDPGVRAAFLKFVSFASVVAAKDQCEYVMISGYRTWDEQTALYQAHQQGGPHAVPAGYSFHNFKLAGDFGVIRAGKYLDDGTSAEQRLAEKIHQACGALAASCGLVWGGRWSGGSMDEPHYQFDIGHVTPTDADRARFKATGSIL